MNRHPRARWALLPVSAIAVAALLSSCGGSTDATQAQAPADQPLVSASQAPGTDQSTAAPSSTTDRAAQREQLRACLAKQGITLPSRPPMSASQPPADGGAGPGAGFGQGGPGGGFAPSGVDPQAFQAAMQACGGFRGGFGGPGGAGRPNSAAFQAYTSCLSDHGVKLPSAGVRPSFSSADPTVAAAMKTCAPLRPKFSGRPQPTPTSS